MMVALAWEPRKDPIFGQGFLLVGLPDPESSGSAYRRASGRAFAHAFISGRYMSHEAKTLPLAIKRLNKEIDKRSVGLFGDDDVTFKVEAA